jgi:hypothetical protein
MPLFTRDGRSVLFIHIPRTGGTTVEQAFLSSGWTMDLLANDAGRTGGPAMPQYLDGSQLADLLDLDRIDRIFTIARDPSDRFRSVVARHAGDPAACRRDAVSAWAGNAFDQLAGDPFHLDNQLRPQVDFLTEDCEVFYYEDGLSNVVREASERWTLGLVPATLPRPRSAEVEIDAALGAHLRRFYAADYATFGYGIGVASVTAAVASAAAVASVA